MRERRAWIEDGYVYPNEGALAGAQHVIRRAWDTISDSRIAFLEGDYERANESLYSAIYLATEALVRKHGCLPAYGFDLKLSQRLSRDVFGEPAVDPLFDQVRTLGSMLPVGPPVSEENSLAIQGSVCAGIEYVARTESFLIARR